MTRVKHRVQVGSSLLIRSAGLGSGSGSGSGSGVFRRSAAALRTGRRSASRSPSAPQRAPGCRDDMVPNGQQALQAVQRGGDNLMLMAVSMPVLHGYAACEALRQLTGGHRVPVVMMAGPRVFKVGATDSISKPSTGPSWPIAGAACCGEHLRRQHPAGRTLAE